MTAPSYGLKIITPQGTSYEGEVTHSLIPVENGFVGVLAHHAAYVTSSPGGRLQVREKAGEEKKFRVGTGFFEVSKNQATFLVQTFQESPAQ